MRMRTIAAGAMFGAPVYPRHQGDRDEFGRAVLWHCDCRRRAGPYCEPGRVGVAVIADPAERPPVELDDRVSSGIEP
jgi:hypothetical protein